MIHNMWYSFAVILNIQAGFQRYFTLRVQIHEKATRNLYLAQAYDIPHEKTTMQFHKNTNRHTAHTIVSWANHKQWQMGHASDLMMIIRSSTCIRTIIIREMGKLYTHSRIYCIKDNWDNWPNVRLTPRQNISAKHFSSSMILPVSCQGPPCMIVNTWYHGLHQKIAVSLEDGFHIWT